MAGGGRWGAQRSKSPAELAAEAESWDAKHLRHHSEILELAAGLWMVEGSNAYPLPRNMFIVALRSGGLLLYSVVAMNEDAMRELEALGMPEIMVVPSRQHTFDAARYKARYPQLTVVCSPEDADVISKRVSVSATFDETDVLEAAGVRVLIPPGLRPRMAGERVLVVPISVGRKKALVFCDLIFNLPPSQCSIITRLLGSGPFFGPTRILRWFGLADRYAFQQFLLDCSYMKGVDAVLMTHGSPVLAPSATGLRLGGDTCTIPELLLEAAARA